MKANLTHNPSRFFKWRIGSGVKQNKIYLLINFHDSYFQNEFLEYPSLLRHAVSLGRRIQDPLSEFAALCVEEDELLCLRLHPFQV